MKDLIGWTSMAETYKILIKQMGSLWGQSLSEYSVNHRLQKQSGTFVVFRCRKGKPVQINKDKSCKTIYMSFPELLCFFFVCDGKSHELSLDLTLSESSCEILQTGCLLCTVIMKHLAHSTAISASIMLQTDIGGAGKDCLSFSILDDFHGMFCFCLLCLF